ncbi:hypothetical protein [Hoeflea poritis]|uniref:Uncharacterized protein n=1 Tax=Hoeflea poritis TaxID=2993659 RepID=A0ABT4VMY2_9HYPH|nr:hypothetical protein [Hoeflea poritis]MDA4846077.1 hypothetical protein [Hoeflea poritis]
MIKNVELRPSGGRMISNQAFENMSDNCVLAHPRQKVKWVMWSTIIALAAIVYVTPVRAESACKEHFALGQSMSDRDKFCEVVNTASRKGTVIVMRKPKCPKSGPSSKCNPSSMPVPDDIEGALIWFNRNGGYGMRPLIRDNAADSRRVFEDALSDYDQYKTLPAGDFGVYGGEWSVVDPTQMQSSDAFQNTLRQAAPWVQHSLSSGDVVIYLQQVDGNGQ